MNDWMSDKVSAMPPLSMDRIEGLAELILEEISPDSLAAPTPFDALHLLERVLPDLGVHILPGEEGELRGCEAFTDPAGTGDIEILVCEDMWDDLHAEAAEHTHCSDSAVSAASGALDSESLNGTSES